MKESSSSSSIRLGGAVISDRVVAALLEELRTGRYADADRLPAEVDLAAELGVSRTVIRDALSEMERAGYIERVRGIGTVVNRTVLNLRSRLDQKLEYYPLIRSFGSYPHADGIQIYPTRAGEELARDLGIEAGDEVKDRLKKSALGLSGGQQQRLCIARALAVEPDVLLMDEPTSALDPISTSKIEELAIELKNRYTIVIVTHNMQQAVRISDNTAFFLLGDLIEYGSTEKMFEQPEDKRTEDYITGRFG